MLKLVSLNFPVGDIHSLVWIREWLCHITQFSYAYQIYLFIQNCKYRFARTPDITHVNAVACTSEIVFRNSATRVVSTNIHAPEFEYDFACSRIDRRTMTSCLCSKVTMGQSRTISQIISDNCKISPLPYVYLTPQLRGFHLGYCNHGEHKMN